MAVVSDRIREKIIADFGSDGSVIVSTLEKMAVPGAQDPERLHAAVVTVARGNRTLFEDAIEHGETDWRDLLDRAGLWAEDWATTVGERFGPA